MNESVEQIATIVLNTTSRENFSGVSNINPEIIRKIRGAQPGIENLLKKCGFEILYYSIPYTIEKKTTLKKYPIFLLIAQKNSLLNF